MAFSTGAVVKKSKDDMIEHCIRPAGAKELSLCCDGTAHTTFPVASDDSVGIENNVTKCSPLTLHEAEVPELAGLTTCTDSSIMKAEIFDPAYDMHQMIAASSDDNILFLSGIDAVSGLSLSLDGDSAFKTASPVKIEGFAMPPNRMSNAGEGVGMFAGSAVVESVFCPNINISGGSSTEIDAHVSKMDAGADDKGYILHLNTSEGNLMVSVDGLMVSQTWPDKETAGGSQVTSHWCDIGKKGNKEDVINSDSGQKDTCSKQTCDYLNGNGNEMQDTKVFVPYGDKGCTDSKVCGRLLETGLMSHFDVVQDSRDSDDYSDRGNPEDEASDVTDDPGPVLVDIERFVICSDGPMKCLLCSFNTDIYSTFKSHIICSHPCWRITKKLSKNRLLVEKSARMNLSVSTVFSTTESPCINRTSPVSLTSKSVANRRSKKAKESHQVAQQLTKLCQQQNARSRQLTQRNKRIFRCGKCQRLFVFEGSIVNHLLDCHDVRKPYKHIEVSNNHGETFSVMHRCMQHNCYVSCSSEHELEKHTHEAHDLVFRCQICGFCGDSTDTVQQHVLNIHHQQLMMYGLTD